MAVHAESSIQLNTIPAYTSLLGGHFVYRANGTTSTPASANVIHGLGSSFNSSNPLTWGYNTHIAADGIKLRYNENDLSEWNTNGLTFYKPGSVDRSMQLSTTDLKFFKLDNYQLTADSVLNNSKNYYTRSGEGTELNPYVYTIVTEPNVALIDTYYEQTTAATLNALGLNITEGSITLGDKFQVTSDGTLSATDVDITGSIEATEFHVGDQNSYISYNPQTGLQINASNTANERTLEYIERIVGFSNWTDKYATFKITEDTTVISGKPYFLKYDIYDYFDDEENFYIYVDKDDLLPAEWADLINTTKLYKVTGATEVSSHTDAGIYYYYLKETINEKEVYIHAPDYTRYILSIDTEVDESKTYYIYSENEYIIVEEPTGNPSEQGYYELHIGPPLGATYYEIQTAVVNEPTLDSSDVYYITDTSIYTVGAILVEHPTIDNIHLYYELTDDNSYTRIRAPEGNPSANNYYEKINHKYFLSKDTVVDNEKIYYSATSISYYNKTTDIAIDSDKHYYIITSNSLADANVSGTHYDRNASTIRVKEEDVDFSILYILSTDTEVDTSKRYFIRSTNIPYTYTQVEQPTGNPSANNYYELEQIYYEIDSLDSALSPYTTNHLLVDEGGINIYDDSNTYGMRINSQGVHILSPEGIPVVSYGAGIVFDSSREFTIGNENNFIKFFKSADAIYPDRIVIQADTINFGNVSLSDTVTGLNNSINDLSGQIDGTAKDLSNNIDGLSEQIGDIGDLYDKQQSEIDNVTGAVQANNQFISIIPRSPNNGPSITVGTDLNAESSANSSISAVRITSDQVSLLVDNKSVAYLSQEKLFATSASVTNLFMSTRDATTGEDRGGIGWVMRSNGHLSLKSM